MIKKIKLPQWHFFMEQNILTRWEISLMTIGCAVNHCAMSSRNVVWALEKLKSAQYILVPWFRKTFFLLNIVSLNQRFIISKGHVNKTIFYPWVSCKQEHWKTMMLLDVKEFNGDCDGWQYRVLLFMIIWWNIDVICINLHNVSQINWFIFFIKFVNIAWKVFCSELKYFVKHNYYSQ